MRKLSSNQVLVCHQLAPALTKLLGMPKNCVSFELRCVAGEIVTVKCEYYPVADDGKLDLFGAAMGDYELVPRTPGDRTTPHDPNVACAGFDTWMSERIDAHHAAFMARTSRHINQQEAPCAN